MLSFNMHDFITDGDHGHLAPHASPGANPSDSALVAPLLMVHVETSSAHYKFWFAKSRRSKYDVI